MKESGDLRASRSPGEHPPPAGCRPIVDVRAHGGFRERRALTMPIRLPFRSVTPALSMATSVPDPMAMPTSAAASAGHH